MGFCSKPLHWQWTCLYSSFLFCHGGITTCLVIVSAQFVSFRGVSSRWGATWESVPMNGMAIYEPEREGTISPALGPVGSSLRTARTSTVSHSVWFWDQWWRTGNGVVKLSRRSRESAEREITGLGQGHGNQRPLSPRFNVSQIL